MQIAAQQVGRLARLIAGCAGLAAAGFGATALFQSAPFQSSLPFSRDTPPASALVPAGLALLLQVLPVRDKRASRVAVLLALGAAALSAAALDVFPGQATATLLAALALACLDLDVKGARYRPADPLVAGAATISLVALVPRMFEPSFVPSFGGPGAGMGPYPAGAVLTLAVGTLLARPESVTTRVTTPGTAPITAPAGPGDTVRRVLPAVIAVPVLVVLVNVLVSHTGVGRAAAAISTGAVLAALAVLAVLGYLMRTLHGAGRRQQDLTGALHEREELTATLLQSINEAVMVLDANYRVIDVNRRWRELTGHDPDEPVRMERPPLPPLGGGDLLVPRVDGTDVPVIATLAPIPDENGAPRGYVATYMDIADRKRAEERLAEHAAELEQGNAALREANTRLESALGFKNDLTSMLTHDVAQPVSSIASLAELLVADWADLPDDVRLELATKIDRNTQRLIKMMNDLQLLFRLDMGSVTARRAPVPLREVAESVLTGIENPAAAEVEVAIDDGLAALADRAHVTVVLQNLLTNALQYGEGPISVRASRSDDTVEVEVCDAGPGIAEEMVPNLFGRFIRSGLGLFIVRHLAEANGGGVRYEAGEPCGTRMIVTWETV